MYAIVEEKRAPRESTMRSVIVSARPDFCMFNPKKESIENSKISQSAPMESANVNEKTAIAQGLPMILCLLYMK